MNTSRLRTLFLIVLAIGVFGCGGEGTSDGPSTRQRTSTQGEDFSPVMARIGDVEITRAYFDYRYENLSPQDKARYSGEDWERRLLETLVEESLIFNQAEEEKLALQRELEYRLDMSRRSILFKAYFDANFTDGVVVPEDRIVEYYEQAPEAFRTSGRALAYHIQSESKERIDEAWKALEGGEVFAAVALRYSEDENTKANEGLLGWFNRDGYVLGMGFNNEFTQYAFSLKPRSLNEPRKIGDNWHIVRMGAITQDEIQPLEKVRDRIVRSLRPVIAREQFQKRLRELEKKWGVAYLGEWNMKDPRTAEQLYRLAAESVNSHAKLDFYQTMVDQYPDHELADEALFMVGFVASEEFGDTPQAVGAFRRLQKDYPESEFVDESQWMMQHLGRVEPQLRGEDFPEDASEVNSRIDDIRE